jgi:hypothetical protein
MLPRPQPWDTVIRANVVPCESICKEKLMQVSKKLAEMATSKQEKSLAAQTARYQDLLMTLGEQEEFIQNDKPLTVKRSGIPHEGPQAWNIQLLEESLVAKQQQQQQQQQQLLLEAPNCIGSSNLPVVIMDDSARLLHATLQTVAATTTLLLQPLASCHALPTLASELLPLPLPLRARTSRRCLAELRQGRSGILVKPKLNPLEGDSSLKSGHGQWWKKDSSAIHVIPKLTIFKQSPRHHHKNKFLIQMANPNMCTVRARLAAAAASQKELYQRRIWKRQTRDQTRLDGFPRGELRKCRFGLECYLQHGSIGLCGIGIGTRLVS